MSLTASTHDDELLAISTRGAGLAVRCSRSVPLWDDKPQILQVNVSWLKQPHPSSNHEDSRYQELQPAQLQMLLDALALLRPRPEHCVNHRDGERQIETGSIQSISVVYMHEYV